MITHCSELCILFLFFCEILARLCIAVATIEKLQIFDLTFFNGYHVQTMLVLTTLTCCHKLYDYVPILCLK